MKYELTFLFGILMLSTSLPAGAAGTTCADAAKMLVDGSRANVTTSPGSRSSGSYEMTWSTQEGHQGVCRVDKEGRVYAVEITRFPAQGGQPYTLTCTSANYRRQECSLRGTAAKIQLDRQLSWSQCVQNRTWGHQGHVLWVDQGCSGRFVVSPIEAWKPYTVQCESVRNGRTDCPIKTPSVVSLTRKLSRSACTEGQSWGYADNTLWVNRGCRGIFTVKAQVGADDNFVDVRGRASDACVAMARTHGFSVSEYRILDVDLNHAEIELSARRGTIDIPLVCRYDVSAGVARLYGN